MQRKRAASFSTTSSQDIDSLRSTRYRGGDLSVPQSSYEVCLDGSDLPGLFEKLKLTICARRGVPRRVFICIARDEFSPRWARPHFSTVASSAWLRCPDNRGSLF